MPDARLLVIGDGPARESLRAGCDDARCPGGAFEWRAQCRPEQVAHVARAHGCGIAPYPADAPFYFSPLKIVEYMAAGVPVVASDIGQIPSLIRHGTTGLLVRPAMFGRSSPRACEL